MSSKTAESTAPAFKGLLGKRRHFLVNWRYQMRASLLTAGVVLVLLILLNLAIYMSTAASADRILELAPEFASVIQSQDRTQLYLILLASMVYLAGVFLVTVLETHRTAGAALNLGARLGEVRRGRYDARLSLRKGDHLFELEEAFNAMTDSLRGRTWDEIESLARLSREAEEIEDAAGGRRLADELRRLADEKRKNVE